MRPEDFYEEYFELDDALESVNLKLVKIGKIRGRRGRPKSYLLVSWPAEEALERPLDPFRIHPPKEEEILQALLKADVKIERIVALDEA